MARVVAVAPDLLFASRIQETLAAAGHQVELASSFSQAQSRLEGDGVDLLVADLDTENAEALAGLGVPVLGFYSHVNAETRQRAQAAGIDLVVPRSRLAREMALLVSRLLG
jgi:CheY-like chemotaxis protein